MIGNDDKFLKNQKEPHGNSWRRNENSKDIEETKISNIKEVSQDDEEFNSVVEKIGIHYDGNKDDEEVNDGGGTEDGCFFLKIPYNLEENPEIKHQRGSCTQGESV